MSSRHPTYRVIIALDADRARRSRRAYIFEADLSGRRDGCERRQGKRIGERLGRNGYDRSQTAVEECGRPNAIDHRCVRGAGVGCREWHAGYITRVHKLRALLRKRPFRSVAIYLVIGRRGVDEFGLTVFRSERAAL